MGSSDRSDSESTPSQENIPTQKKMQQQGREPLHKKRKDNKIDNIDTLTEEDICMLTKSIAAVSKDSLAALKTEQVSIADQFGNHLNKLVDAINEVKATIEAEIYGMDPNVPLVTPELVELIKVRIQGWALETGMDTTTFDDVVRDFSTL